LREFDNKKILFYKLSVRYLVVKPACVNAALIKSNPSHLRLNGVKKKFYSPEAKWSQEKFQSSEAK